jgi:hypothetical protein
MDELNKKLNKKLNEAKDILDPTKVHLFVANELIASVKTLKLLKGYVKENYDEPKKNIKGYIIRFNIDKKNKILLHIELTQVTITPKLFIGPKDDDAFQTFTYTKEELIKYGFKLSQIKKMIKAIKNNTISFEKSSISITELIIKS